MQYLTQPELKRLLAAMYTEQVGGLQVGRHKGHVVRNAVLDPLRRKALILVTYWHGLRATEAISLTGADIQGGYVRVPRLKGSEATIQPYVEHDDPMLDESAVLTELAAQVKPNELLFPISRVAFWYLVKRAAQRAGLPAHLGHPHCLKHTCARVAITQGIQNAQKYLGHKSMHSTGQYLKVSERESNRAFKKATKAIELVMED